MTNPVLKALSGARARYMARIAEEKCMRTAAQIQHKKKNDKRKMKMQLC